jgi:hypothetical protein
MPDNSHPPMMCPKTPAAFAAKRRPRPNGSSYVTEANLWRVSNAKDRSAGD